MGEVRRCGSWKVWGEGKGGAGKVCGWSWVLCDPDVAVRHCSGVLFTEPTGARCSLSPPATAADSRALIAIAMGVECLRRKPAFRAAQRHRK